MSSGPISKWSTKACPSRRRPRSFVPVLRPCNGAEIRCSAPLSDLDDFSFLISLARSWLCIVLSGCQDRTFSGYISTRKADGGVIISPFKTPQVNSKYPWLRPRTWKAALLRVPDDLNPIATQMTAQVSQVPIRISHLEGPSNTRTGGLQGRQLLQQSVIDVLSA